MSKPKNSHRTITGCDLKTALSAMIQVIALADLIVKIKVYRDGASNWVEKVHPAVALSMIRSGNWEGKIKGVRVYSIREVDLRKRLHWQHCFRTTDAAVCPPPLGWDKNWSPGLASKFKPRKPIPQNI